MAVLRLTQRLSAEYTALFASSEIAPQQFAVVDKLVDRMLANRSRYDFVAQPLKVPWYFISAIHTMESSQQFDRHLHNGDPLTAKTKLIPKGRPMAGEPPFTWEESADDALRLKRLDRVTNWSLPRLLYEIENYNGWGYRRYHPEVLSPYLWSFSNHYQQGKYIYDGTWSHTAISKQCGAAVLLRRLQQRGEIPSLGKQRVRFPVFQFNLRSHNENTADLQRYMNTLEAVSLRVDGQAGPKTSEAVHTLFGTYLRGDPRNDL